MREIKIGKNDAGQRLDKFLTKSLDLPQSLLYKSIRLKKIKLNRKRTQPNVILTEGDTLQCFLAEEFFERGRKSTDEITNITERELTALQVKLNIIYEDENILLVDKPVGLSVHEDESTKRNTLISYIQSYLYKKGEYDPCEEQSFAPALCNRIDKNTGGIVIAAKNAEALRVLNEKIKSREIQKRYLAVVHGVPEATEKTLYGYLIKDEKTNTVRVYDDTRDKRAKSIVTRYRVMGKSRDRSLSLIEVELLTGRTHQIRAHMAHIGHPLLGDGKYGDNKKDRALGYKHQALYSYRLKFTFSESEKTKLDYLSGREFSVPKSSIYFIKEFF